MGRSNMNEKYNSLRSNSSNFCLEAAISEFIDNSIQSIVNDLSKKLYKSEEKCDLIYKSLENEKAHDRDEIINKLREYNLVVSINTKESSYDDGRPVYIIQIIDNACGIPHDKIVQCMRKGETISANDGKVKNSMNNYGVGLKTACFYLGKNAKIYSKPADQKYITFGDYDSPLDDADPRTSQDVSIIDEKIKKGEENFDIIKDHGTIVEIYSFSKEHFDVLQKSKEQSNINFSLTVGMKYSKYIDNHILKIQIQNNGKCIKEIKSKSLFAVSNDETKYSPFKIKDFYEAKKEILSETKNIKSVEDLQNYLKQEMLKIEDKSFKYLLENNESLRNVFENTQETLWFTINHEFNGKRLPVKVGIMSHGKQAFSHVNVLSQWRYINLPCLNDEKNAIVRQWKIFDSDWKDPTSARWSFFEFNLIDLEGNENYDYFIPETNKISFVVNKNSNIDINERKEFTKSKLADSLVNLKKALGPFTDIFKDLESATAKKSIPKKINDTFGINITPNLKTNTVSYEIKEGITSELKYNNNDVEDSNLVSLVSENNAEINTRSKHFPIKSTQEINWVILAAEIEKYISKNLQLADLISQKINPQCSNYQEIMEIVDNLKKIKTLEDLMKKDKENG